MKLLFSIFAFLTALSFIFSAQGMTVQEYIQEANKLETDSKLVEASDLLEQAAKEHPNNSDIFAYWGSFVGRQAGQTEDMGKAAAFSTKSFELLDKAVELDEENPNARLFRGIMGVNVPSFLGKLKIAITDLKYVEKIWEEIPQEIPLETLITSYRFLAMAYEKNEQPGHALYIWKKIGKLAPQSVFAEEALKNIQFLEGQGVKEEEPKDVEEIQAEKTPKQSKKLIEQGQEHINAQKFDEAAKVLREAIEVEPDNLYAHKQLLMVLGELSQGYNEEIQKDTDYKSNLAFEVMRSLDKIVELTPSNLEMRLKRGIVAVQMPFFVRKLDQGIQDLKSVSNSKAPDQVKAEALYWLGFAHQKKATEYWNKIVKDYPDSRAKNLVFDAMNPGIQYFDFENAIKPILVIDFVLGFRDQLAPQTAVWIEDAEGQFIRTIYVSAFSGFAKDAQPNLFDWAESSHYSDADAVTAASIDLGHHIYTWDLTDSEGKKVENGGYVVKVEVHYWPSMEYQIVSTPVQIGTTETQKVVEEGNLIPYLKAEFYPE